MNSLTELIQLLEQETNPQWYLCADGLRGVPQLSGTVHLYRHLVVEASENLMKRFLEKHHLNSELDGYIPNTNGKILKNNSELLAWATKKRPPSQQKKPGIKLHHPLRGRNKLISIDFEVIEGDIYFTMPSKVVKEILTAARA